MKNIFTIRVFSYVIGIFKSYNETKSLPKEIVYESMIDSLQTFFSNQHITIPRSEIVKEYNECKEYYSLTLFNLTLKYHSQIC